jgi:predicted phosphohydrolase
MSNIAHGSKESIRQAAEVMRKVHQDFSFFDILAGLLPLLEYDADYWSDNGYSSQASKTKKLLNKINKIISNIKDYV